MTKYRLQSLLFVFVAFMLGCNVIYDCGGLARYCKRISCLAFITWLYRYSVCTDLCHLDTNRHDISEPL
jgi:hypothetical protein